jgi:hypothetical protein
VLRLDWTSFAIRFISIGKEFNLETVADGVTVLRDTPAAWYTGIWGQLLGLLMFVGLGVITFVLAKWGAKMQMKEEDS